MPFSGCEREGKPSQCTTLKPRSETLDTHQPLFRVEDETRQELGALEPRLLSGREHLLEDGVDDSLVGTELLERVTLLDGRDALALEEMSEVGFVEGGNGDGLGGVRVGVHGEVAEDCGREEGMSALGSQGRRARERTVGTLVRALELLEGDVLPCVTKRQTESQRPEKKQQGNAHSPLESLTRFLILSMSDKVPSGFHCPMSPVLNQPSTKASAFSLSRL